ncbi:MAG TPA: hypothetical protein VFE37_29185 [Chloroflexota bacterium]|nr:hypothetical protein [Chloroflexota bacterium]
MSQVVAAPITGRLTVATPAWDKASHQKRAADRAPDVVGWLAAAAATALLTVGVIALLAAEYGLLWAMLVTPWLDQLPLLLPQPF